MGEIVKKAYKDQHNGNFPTTPPTYLGRIAKAMWRRVLPVLEQQSVIERIDANMVENYCSAYEIYREAYESIKKDGVQQAIYRSVQNSSVINIFS
ncbi:phage terminase small subunit [Lacticaseibacillus paracasei subsp. paracasei Lpp41]|uniref:Phage terminase small subunit n=1 Tax=Lacticaseibacillus paracasei subsp. paracasei Lpp41 TaxID=1256208 RepID=A0A829H8U4_LACPA|nr:phage terminase small subunit [Lacticaseibacillus paracasei subsp. paracasei Lpp41]